MIDEIVRSHLQWWQSKRFKFKASRIPCDEAYLSYAAITTGWSATQKLVFLQSHHDWHCIFNV